MRRLQSYINKYGPEVGPLFYRALQSQAAHAGVSARLRRKIERLRSEPAAPSEPLPLFPEPEGQAVEVGSPTSFSSEQFLAHPALALGADQALL